MKYALIGCGRIAVNHIKAALDNHLELRAVCDVKPEMMDTLLARYSLETEGLIRRYADYREMLEKEDLDLVSIATESGLHAQIALDCLDAGVNVIIEKPMAMSMEDANSIIRKAGETRRKVCVCHQNRFNPAVQALRTALEAGRFGKLSHGSIHVRWNRDRKYYAQAPWRGTWAMDGGCLMNQCIHGIDLLRWMMGNEVEEVFGFTRRQFHDYLECEDVGLAVVRFKNGALGSIEGTVNAYPRNLEETLYVFGENGTVTLGGPCVNNIEQWRFADTRPEDEALKSLREQAGNVYGNGHGPLFADMVDAIERDRRPYVDAVAGRNALEMVLAVYKSSASDAPVRLPLAAAASNDFVAMFDISRICGT